MSKPRFSKLQKLIITIDHLARPPDYVLLQRDVIKVIRCHLSSYANDNSLNAAVSRSLGNLKNYGLVDRAWVTRSTYKKWRHAYPISHTDSEPTPFKTWDFRTLAIQVEGQLKRKFASKIINDSFLSCIEEVFDPRRMEIFEPADWIKAAIPDRELRRDGIGVVSEGRRYVEKMLEKYK